MNHVEALALIAQGGDAAKRGMGEIFESFYPSFKNLFLRNGFPLAQAEDLASQSISKIFYKLFYDRKKLPTDQTKFTAWANTVACNTMNDHLRELKIQRKNEIDSPTIEDDGGSEDGESPIFSYLNTTDYSKIDIVTRLCLIQQMNKFYDAHPERAACLERLIYTKESMAELSQSLGRTPGATREYISQCRKRLYNYLQECLL